MRQLQYILLLFVVLCPICHLKGQNNPQYSFYGDFDLSFVNQNAKDDADESERIELVLFFSKYFELDDKQLIDLYYRHYEIEHTSVVGYTTIDKQPLLFHCKDSMDNAQNVDFGTPLINNNPESDSTSFKLCFASPVNKIDPNLFSFTTSSIKFPSTKNLTYQSSPDICVSNLSELEGYDVCDYSALISKDSVLIAAATKGRSSYVIPENVKCIGSGAFRGSMVNTIIVPPRVASIGDNSFAETKITSLYFMSTEVPKIEGESSNMQLSPNTILYVPQKSQKKYKKKWSAYKKQIKPFPKSFNDTLALINSFSSECKYRIKYGFELSPDNQIINKRNRFYNQTKTVDLNSSAAYLWKEIKNKPFDIELLARLLTKEYDVDIDTARKDCKNLLENWYRVGLICKSY